MSEAQAAPAAVSKTPAASESAPPGGVEGAPTKEGAPITPAQAEAIRQRIKFK